MQEIWKDIKGYEGLYQVSNLGRVKSLDRIIKGKLNSKRLRRGKILKSGFDRCGYKQYSLSRDGKLICKKAHRLVAEAFIPNDKNKPQINHKNGIKHDNNIENLEWVTASENSKHAFATGLRKVNIVDSKNHPMSKNVYQFTLDGRFIKMYDSIWQACRKIGCTSSNINSVCMGITQKAFGYVWRYKKDFNFIPNTPEIIARKEKLKKYHQEYYNKNKERILEYQKKLYYENKKTL